MDCAVCVWSLVLLRLSPDLRLPRLFLFHLAGNLIHNERHIGSGAAARYLRRKDEAFPIIPDRIPSELTIAAVKTVLVLDLGSQTSHVRSIQILFLLCIGNKN